MSAQKKPIITKRGKPVEQLSPIAPAPARSTLGRWKGQVVQHGDIVNTDWSQEFDACRR